MGGWVEVQQTGNIAGREWRVIHPRFPMTWLSQTSSGSLPTLFGAAVPVMMQGGLRQTARNVMQLGWRRLASRPASCGQAGRKGDRLGSEWSAIPTRDLAAPQQTSVFVAISAARTPCCCGGRWEAVGRTRCTGRLATVASRRNPMVPAERYPNMRVCSKPGCSGQRQSQQSK